MTSPEALRAVGGRVLRATREHRPDGTWVEEAEWLAGPGWPALPVHHHDGDERYEFLSGRVRVVIEGASRIYRAGESVIVAAGRPHTLQPIAGHGIHIRVQRWLPPAPSQVSLDPLHDAPHPHLP